MPTTRTPRPAAARDAARVSAVIASGAIAAPARRTARGRTLPPAKTGNPRADRVTPVVEKPAVLDELPAAPVGLSGQLKSHCQFYLANGMFHVHKAGCRDVRRGLKDSDYDEAISGQWATEEEAIRELWDDQIHDDVKRGVDPEPPAAELLGYLTETNFSPCCNLIPFPSPVSRDEDGNALEAGPIVTVVEPKPAPRDTEKAARARAVRRQTRPKGQPTTTTPTTPARPESAATAARREAKRKLARKVLLAAEEMVKGLPEGERQAAASTVSQWLHHLPVRGDDDGRWWPTSFPTPDRSDWR